MNPEVKEKWLEALRSGEYKQGQGYLNMDGKFCCLGVLCEVAVKQGVDVAVEERPDRAVRYNGAISDLPDKLREWSDLGFMGSLPEPVEGYESLAGLNDYAGYSFAQIADVIEKHL